MNLVKENNTCKYTSDCTVSYGHSYTYEIVYEHTPKVSEMQIYVLAGESVHTHTCVFSQHEHTHTHHHIHIHIIFMH